MFLCDRPSDVNHGKQYEYVCLQKGNHDMQAVENDWNTNWNHRKEDKSNQIPGKDVCPQANRKRKQTSRMANDLNWHHQGSEKRHRADEMLQVLEHSVLADPLQIVKAECAQGATERHGRCGSCGRLKTRY